MGPPIGNQLKTPKHVFHKEKQKHATQGNKLESLALPVSVITTRLSTPINSIRPNSRYPGNTQSTLYARLPVDGEWGNKSIIRKCCHTLKIVNLSANIWYMTANFKMNAPMKLLLKCCYFIFLITMHFNKVLSQETRQGDYLGPGAQV